MADIGKNEMTILEMLQDSGIGMKDMIESAMELYTPHPEADADKSLDEIKRRLEKIIRQQCCDNNVRLLLAAAIHLDREIENGLFGIEGDPASIVADELIGISIAEYIGGKKALFNFIRYDKEKPGILSKLGVFLDDAVGGLIAGCMTKLFEDWK